MTPDLGFDVRVCSTASPSDADSSFMPSVNQAKAQVVRPGED